MMAEDGEGGEAVSLGYFYEDISHSVRVFSGRNLTFPMHLHMQAELVYVSSGHTLVTIEGKARVLGAGEAAMVWPGSVHGYDTQGESAHIIAIVDASVLGDYQAFFTEYACADPFLPSAAVHPDVGHCLETLAKEAEIAEPLRRAYLRVAVGRVVDALTLVPRRAAGGPDALHSLLTYIGAHIAEPISLDSLSKALFLNRYTISKMFSERVGCSLHSYVNALRVSMAENLLRDTQMDISRIAERCGFGSERTFYRAFAEIRGVAPGRLRKERGGNSSARR